MTAKTTNGLTAKIKVTVKEIYDIILFTGQSNMVGKAMETIETRYNHNIYNYSGAKSVEQYSKMTGIDKNILNNNGKTLDELENIIQNICAKNLEGNNAQKAISSSLKSQYDGEWIVLVVNSNDNFEFNISDFPINNALMLQSGPKIIYICKYV